MEYRHPQQGGQFKFGQCDDVVLNLYNSPGVSPLNGRDISQQLLQNSKFKEFLNVWS